MKQKLFSFPGFLTLAFFFGAVSVSCDEKKRAQAFDNDFVVGTYQGEPVRIGELLTKNLSDSREKYFQSLEAAFMGHLIERFKEDHPDLFGDNKPITDAELKRFYDESGLAERGTFAELKTQIHNYFERDQNSSTYRNALSKAEKKGLWKFYPNEPEPFSVQVDIETAFVRGNAEAKVMLLEFSDYQCPYCKRVQPSIARLIEKYGERVAFGYRHFPLNFHTEADEAAIAVECAREQDLFEELHGMIFNTTIKPFPETLKNFAQGLPGIDFAKFKKCFEGERYRGLVDRDIQVGLEIGINGTPGFVIGRYDPKTKKVKGEVLSGALPFSAFEERIEKYLKNS